MIKVILFDLDDTLISEEEYIYSGYRHVASKMKERYHIKSYAIADELYRLYKNGTKNVFNCFLDMLEIHYETDDIMYLVNAYRSHTPTIFFYEDVLETVQALRDKGIRIGIISDGYLEAQKRKAEAVQLPKYFEKIIFTDELGKKYWKPSSKPFEIMRDYFDVNNYEMVYVGDNPQKDFYIKMEFPIKTIRIVRPNSVYRDSEYLGDVKEDIRIMTLRELLNVI